MATKEAGVERLTLLERKKRAGCFGNIEGGVAVGKERKTMLKMFKEAGFVLTLHSDFLILNV